MSKQSRRARRKTTTVDEQQSILDRYRRLLIGVVVVAAVGVMGYVVLSSATASAYTCDSLLQAPPGQATFALADFGDELPGFPTGNDGRDHKEGSATYVSCPPTSGEHRAAGALQRDSYGPGAIQEPNDWVHNLEHGYAVIALRFDEMSEPFAVLAWRRALLMQDFDVELATAAAQQFQDLPQAPERAC